MKTGNLPIILLLMFASCTQTTNNSVNTSVAAGNSEEVGMEKYEQYCNHRFNYCIEYPAHLLTAEEDAENMDGKRFFSADERAILTVYGTNAASMAFDEYFEFQLTNAETDIETKDSGTGWFTLSGTKKGYSFYEKSIAKDDAYVTVTLEFDPSLSSTYIPVWERVSASLNPQPSI